MSKKFRKMCPEEYTDTNESDPDYMADLSFSTQESQSEASLPPSPKIKRSKAARRCTQQRQTKCTPESTQGEKTVVDVQIPGTSSKTRLLERSLTYQSRIDSINEAEKIYKTKRKCREDSTYENV